MANLSAFEEFRRGAQGTRADLLESIERITAPMRAIQSRIATFHECLDPIRQMQSQLAPFEESLARIRTMQEHVAAFQVASPALDELRRQLDVYQRSAAMDAIFKLPSASSPAADLWAKIIGPQEKSLAALRSRIAFEEVVDSASIVRHQLLSHALPRTRPESAAPPADVELDHSIDFSASVDAGADGRAVPDPPHISADEHQAAEAALQLLVAVAMADAHSADARRTAPAKLRRRWTRDERLALMGILLALVQLILQVAEMAGAGKPAVAVPAAGPATAASASQVIIVVAAQYMADLARCETRVATRPVRVRSEPRGGRILAVARAGQNFSCVEKEGKWLRVHYHDDATDLAVDGWVMKKYATLQQPPRALE